MPFLKLEVLSTLFCMLLVTFEAIELLGDLVSVLILGSRGLDQFSSSEKDVLLK